MRPARPVQNVLVVGSALLFAASLFVPRRDQSGPVLSAATTFVRGAVTTESAGEVAGTRGDLGAVTRTALDAFAGIVRPLSRPEALESAFKSYFAYKRAHSDEITKPYLYFVDYGLPSTTPRGYVFDMDSLRVIDGPFTVAHGRGSSTARDGVPSRFSNASGSNATSLGLYVARAIYSFHGKSAGHSYGSVGLRLMGVSHGFNDNAFARGVVAHGAPYVTPNGAGRSEGCPAMEPQRAERLLPKLADGGMVFLFAPDERWMTSDPWVASGAE